MDIYVNPDTLDWELTETHLKRVEGTDEIAQHVLITLRLHLAEFGYDLGAGVPWREEIMTKATDDRRVARLTAIVAAVPGVTSVKQIRIVHGTDRAATIYVDALTDEGPITVEAAAPAA